MNATMMIVREIFGDDSWNPKNLEALKRFAEKVREHEREACAEVCEDQMQWGEINKTIVIAAGNCADAIRARGDK
jgi:hypothetical protein